MLRALFSYYFAVGGFFLPITVFFGPLTRTRISLGPLTAQWQSAAVTQTAVAADVDKPA